MSKILLFFAASIAILGCTKPTPKGGFTGSSSDISIATLLDMGKSATDTTKIILGVNTVRGVVVASSNDSNCIGRGYVYLEDSTGRAIEIYYGVDNIFYAGDSLLIDLTGDSLTEYYGYIAKVNSFAVQTVVYHGSGHLQPKMITINQINTSYIIDTMEYTLVTIKHVTFPAGIFSGSVTITDTSTPANSLTMYTPNTATFAGETLPGGGKTYTVTGVLTSYAGGIQFSIRTPADIVPE